MNLKRVLLFALLAILLVSCSQSGWVFAPTPTPVVIVMTATVPPAAPTVPPTQTPRVITATPLAATATPIPTNTSLPTATAVPPTATPVPPTSTRAPTSTPAPSPTSEFPAGMGALKTTNFIGQYDITITINGSTYTIPKGGGQQIIFLPPGHYTFSANIPGFHVRCEMVNNCAVDIQAGQYTLLPWY